MIQAGCQKSRYSSVQQKWLDISARPWFWVPLILGVIVLNVVAGPQYEMPFLVIIPTALATWHRGLKWGIPLAIILPTVRLGIHMSKGWSTSWTASSVNCVNRALVLIFLIFLVDRVARQTRDLKQKVKMLEGIVPICCMCKKIRDEQQGWQRLETYIEAKSEAEFSHGFCPDCMREQYGDELADAALQQGSSI